MGKKHNDDETMTDREYRDELKKRKQESIARSKKSDRAWQRLIRSQQYEDLDKDADLIPRNVHKNLVR